MKEFKVMKAVLMWLVIGGVFILSFDTGLVYRSQQDPGERLGYAKKLMKQEKYQQAIQLFKEIIIANPDEKDAWVWLTKAFSRARDFDAGERFFVAQIQKDSTQAFAWYGLGNILYQKNQWQKALGKVEKALALKRELIEAWITKSTLLRNLGHNRAALAACDTALGIAIQLDDTKGKALVLMEKGSAYYFLRVIDSTLSNYKSSLKIAQTQQDTMLQVFLLNNMGIVYRTISDIPNAISCLRLSMKLAGEETPQALGNIGDCFFQSSKYDSAIFYYNKALAMMPPNSDPKLRGNLLSSLGATHSLQGKNEIALQELREAIRLHRQIGFLSGMTTNLINLGAIYVETNDLSRGLEYFMQARDIADKLAEPYDLQVAVGNIGEIYRLLGDYKKALDYLEKATKLAYSVRDSSRVGAWLGATASCHLALKDTVSALSTFRQAARILIRIHDTRNAALVYADMASIFSHRGRWQDAEKYFTKALSFLKAAGNPFSMGILHNQIADMYFKRRQYPAAKEHYQKALQMGSQLHAEHIIWQALFGLGKVSEHQGKFAKARTYYHDAIAHIEGIRSKLPEDFQRIHYVQNKVAVYEKMINLLQQRTKPDGSPASVKEAFSYAERIRARALLDLLTAAKVNLDEGVDKKLLAEETQLQQEITRVQIHLYPESETSDAYKRLQKRLRELEDNLDRVHFQMAAQRARRVKQATAKPLTADYVQKKILQDGEVLLEYFLGKNRSWLWCITSQAIRAIELPSRSYLDSLAMKYFAEISRPPLYGSRFSRAGEQLYKHLLVPAAPELENARHVVIIPDGALHLVPFETFIIGEKEKRKRYAIEKWHFSYAPSASVLARLMQSNSESHEKPKLDLLIFADPKYEPDMHIASKRGELLTSKMQIDTISINLYQQRGFSLSNLSWSDTEGQAIAALFPREKVVVYTGDQASEDQVKKERLDQFKMIHFSTHGLLDEENPLRSCLVFSLDNDPAEDGFLQLREIMALQLDADLAVLSACQTGRGRFSNGEGIVGLTRAFFYAGTRALVSSLWRVDDRSTAELMAIFYRFLRKGLTTAEALHQAQLEFLTGANQRWQHPYFWAPFVLHGRYRIRPAK
ncbi:MAG: CHAT domain-containing protein [Calditrichaeota bacterium]|nr:MAG: CHAT domain-containing protein [Calditrichota bacterium]